MGPCEHVSEPAPQVRVGGEGGEVEIVVGGPLSESLGKLIVEPLSSLAIGEHHGEKSELGLEVNCQVAADTECGNGGNVEGEEGNLSSIEVGLSRMRFEGLEGRVCKEVEDVVCASTGCVSQEKAAGEDLSVGKLPEVVVNNSIIGSAEDGSVENMVIDDSSGVVVSHHLTPVVESSELVNNEKNGNEGLGDESLKSPDTPSLSLRRSSRNRKTVQQVQGGQRATKSKKKASSRTVDLLSNATRKKRSSMSRSTCSASWGLSGNLSKYFGPRSEVIVGKELDQRTKRKARRKSGKEEMVEISQVSVGKRDPDRPIRFKVTFGKKEELNMPEIIPLVAVDAVTDMQPRTNGHQPDLGSSLGDAGENTDVAVKQEITSDDKCTNSIAKTEIGGTDFESTAPLVEFKDMESSRAGSDKLDISCAERHLDPSTSPDSEVVDQILDSSTGLILALYNPVNVTSNDGAGPAKSCVTSNTKKSKSRKNKKDIVADNSGLEDTILRLAGASKSKSSKKGGKQKNRMNGLCSIGTVVTVPTDNPSSNTSGSEIISMELSATDECKIQGLGSGSDVCSGIVTETQNADLRNCSQLLSSEKTQKKRNSKGARPQGKCRSRKESTGQCKGKQRKAERKHKLTANATQDETFEMGGILETDGHVMVDDREANACEKVAPGSDSCLDIQRLDNEEPILPPRVAWVCCDDCQKWRCIPAELADRIEQMNCRWTCKDNQDEAYADCSIPQGKSNAEINAELQISDEEDPRDGHVGCKDGSLAQAVAPQPSKWTLIKSNLFLHRNRKSQTMDEIMVCHCKPFADGSLGCGSQCLNRMLNIECVKGTCPCGDLCSNQQFQRRQYAKLQWFRCGRKGYGLQVLEDISKGQFVIEYVGEVLGLQAYETRLKEYASKGHKHFYFMTLNGNEVIDACSKGNLGRFVNHSCDPNCRTEKWVVNGEICVGLFAQKNIKKGEELTFDYNYVRVFGAAAKKCHCGSLKCRGYIGGDPNDADVVVQGDSDDEFPEPEVVYEDGEIDRNLGTKSRSPDREPLQSAKTVYGEKLEVKQDDGEILSKADETPTNVIVQSPTAKKEEPANGFHEVSDDIAVSHTADVIDESVSVVQKISSSAEHTTASSTSSSISAFSPTKRTVLKSLPSSIDADGRFSEVENAECGQTPSKPRPRMKISRPSKSIKNKKSPEKPPVVLHRPEMLFYKPKKQVDELAAVEEKLNDLLDADGGICKRKDASKGYLKLLLLTAASGDSCNGGAIQSNRDLSMILDAILKTRSRGVLLDIINKNGLQMLHNMLKLYRRDFKKIPILRKLLKVFEFLADKEILTVDRINEDSLRPGVESFRDSILSFTEHEDKKVYQTARDFRDRWMPWSVRKFCIEKAERNREFNRFSNSSKYFGTYHWKEPEARLTEPVDHNKKEVNCNNSIDMKMQDAASPHIADNQVILSKPRKRKSRWDQPANPVSPRRNKERKIQPTSPGGIIPRPNPDVGVGGVGQEIEVREDTHCSSFEQNCCNLSSKEDDVIRDDENDAPPGFSSPHKPEDDAPPGFSSSHSSPLKGPANCSSEVSTGLFQERFNSSLPVAYGIPSTIMQQFGILESGTVESWMVAPSILFQPFPPLPPYPRGKRSCPQPCLNEAVMTKRCREEPNARFPNSDASHDQDIPSTSSPSPAPLHNVLNTNKNVVHQERGFCNNLDRRYYRQQKKYQFKRAPFCRREGWIFKGNHPRNGLFNSAMNRVANQPNDQHI